MVRKYLLAAALLAVSISTPASARPWHGGVSPGAGPAAPVLTNATVTFGASTPNGRGAGVRLSAQDFTSPSYIPTPVSGLGLMSASGPACDTWVSFTFASNTAGRTGADFNIIGANTPEGSGAQAPNTSGTGATHLAGDYVWNVQCSAAGILSNVATLTYHTVANEVTVGPADRFDFGWAPTNFGSVAGAKVCLATGGDFHALRPRMRGVTLGSTLANPLTFTVCDSPRYPYVSNFTTSGLSHIIVSDIVATGNTDVGIQTATNIFGSSSGDVGYTDATWNNLRYYGGPNMYPSTGTNSGQAFFSSACSSSCLFENSIADFVNSGFTLTDGLHATNIDIGHFSNNCTAVISGDVGWTLDGFSTCHDGLISNSGQHTDTMQILDGATLKNGTVNNFWAIQAGSTGFPQGPWFGGGQFGETTKVWIGYIDDGTGAHGPGTILTITSGGGCFSSSNFSQVWIPSGGISIADDVHILCGAGQSTGISTTNLAATNIGSPGSPVAISNVGAYSFQLEGVVNTSATFGGVSSSGESGTSFLKHFGWVVQQPNPFVKTSFTGTINGVIGSYASGTTVTVAGPITTSNPGINDAAVLGALSYAGCPSSGNAACNTAINSNNGIGVGGEAYSTEAVQASSSTVSFNGKTMTVTGPCVGRFDYNITNGSHLGGLMISGTGIPDFTYIVPTLFLPSDGCAGNYTLNQSVGVLSSRAVQGRPQQGAGVYGLYNYGTGATPIGPVAMTATPFVGVSGGAWVSQVASAGSPGCTASLHTGTFLIANGYANGGINLCGAPVTNTTTSNTITPVAADYLTGALPTTTLNAITVSTWNAMTTAQKRAATCNAMLPAPGHSLDLGGGDWIGPFTSTGEVILAGGNVAVTGCGIH